MRSTLRRISTAAVAAMAVLTAALPGTATARGGPGQQGRTYHVATWGSDRDGGSERHPLRTIGRCTDLVRPGDTCLIHRGDYRERVAPPSGRAGAPITLAAYGDGPVTVDGTRTVTGWKDAGGGLVAADAGRSPDRAIRPPSSATTSCHRPIRGTPTPATASCGRAPDPPPSTRARRWTG
ncbi:hypothetical protein [Streptomyces sp. NBRC 110028]|uniref:hypothetical protein n=1 Tax=Streptomyces sp. NBRC 110028 TaxID=1621260 RepID=UPI0006E1ED3B|nr:hypothetical protein [Streptomyces sp. NBRC 110028]